MKKILAIVLSLAMVLSLGVIFASAEDEWAPFGTREAEFDADASKKLTLDGELKDWIENKYTSYELNKNCFDPWVGAVPDEWSITLYFTADNENFYIAFQIFDDSVSANTPGAYNQGGDSFQIQIDYNGICGESEAFCRAVFYSFGYQESGEIDMIVQCINDDDASGVDYAMSSSDTEAPEGYPGCSVKGKCKLMDDGKGWQAEIALPWQTIYNNLVTKMDTIDETIEPFTFDDEHPLTLGMLICYLDYTDATFSGAWGTSIAQKSLGGGAVDADNNPIVGWYPENAGAKLVLKGAAPVLTEPETTESAETTAPETTAPETTAPETTAPETTAPETTAPETTAPETTAPETTAPETTKAPDTTEAASGGCGGVVGGVFAILGVVALAGVAIKKKH